MDVIMENPIKTDDLGVPLFLETSSSCLEFFFVFFVWWFSFSSLKFGHRNERLAYRKWWGLERVGHLEDIPSRKFNIAPENGWLEDEFPFGFRSIFRCYVVSFREGKPNLHPWLPSCNLGFMLFDHFFGIYSLDFRGVNCLSFPA